MQEPAGGVAERVAFRILPVHEEPSLRQCGSDPLCFGIPATLARSDIRRWHSVSGKRGNAAVSRNDVAQTASPGNATSMSFLRVVGTTEATALMVWTLPG
jgi:hypothetical protein